MVRRYKIIIQDGGGRHFEFSLSPIARLLLRLFARNLESELILWSYVRTDYNIKQKLNPRWRPPPSWIFAQTLIAQLPFELN